MALYTTRPYHTIKFIKENFVDNNDEHIFLIMATKDHVIERNPRLLSFTDLLFEPKLQKKKCNKFDRINFLVSHMKNAECILWHSFLTLHGKMWLPTAIRNEFMKKSVWIKHIHDVDYSSKYSGRIKRRLNQFMQHKARKNTLCIGGLLGIDIETIKQCYGEEKTYVQLISPILESHITALNNEILRERNITSKTIIIGMDGRPANRHADIINYLKDIEGCSALFPMNYSMLYEYGITNSSAYISEIRRLAKNSLKIPFVILNSGGVPEENYFKLLNNASVAIFGGNNPIFPDLVLYLFALGKKIYIPSDSPFEVILSELGFVTFDYNIDSTEEHNYDNFFEIDDEIKENNATIALEILSKENICNKWNDLFNVIIQNIERR